MKKNIPNELKMLQDERRILTIKKIENGIIELESEGAFVSIPALVVRTGLSRAVFNKVHVREVLKDHNIGPYAINNIKSDKQLDYRDLFIKMENENNRLRNKITKFEESLYNKNKMIQNCEKKISEQEIELEILRGKLYQLLKKASLQGVVFQDSILYNWITTADEVSEKIDI